MRIPGKKLDKSYPKVYLASALGTSMAAVPSGSLLIMDNSATQVLPVAPPIGWWVDVRVRGPNTPLFNSGGGNTINANVGAAQTVVLDAYPASFRLAYVAANTWEALFESSPSGCQPLQIPT